MVFTHRINLPPSAGCGCPPGTEPPVPASEVQALRVRLEILEELVKGLKEQCTGGCCPAAAQAGTGEQVTTGGGTGKGAGGWASPVYKRPRYELEKGTSSSRVGVVSAAQGTAWGRGAIWLDVSSPPPTQ